MNKKWIWYIIYELILIGCLVIYGYWYAGRQESCLTHTITITDALPGLIPLAIILLMALPSFTVLHDGEEP